jgi:hypothetical protein
MIEIIEDYLPNKIQKEIWDYCLAVSYKTGVADTPYTSPSGITHDIEINSKIGKYLSSPLKKNPLTSSKNIYRININCFYPSENPYWHNDGEGVTCLYYPNLEYDNLSEGGETQFLLPSNDIRGILPRPNRMILFDGMIPHRATSFRTQIRYTIALKYEI